ncbi:MAG: phytoene desaturase family protein [Thermoleophilaceae bacterium]
MRIVVLGAGVGGLAAGARLAALGHRATVLEQAAAPGGKAGRVEMDGYAFDSGPSLLTMPWVLADLFTDTGAALEEDLELVRVEPGTEYRFADGSSVALGADLPPTLAALERFAPGAGEDWARHLGACSRHVEGLRAGPLRTRPWPPRRPRRGERRPSPADLLRIRPWRTLRGLARSTIRDPRLRLVVERGATYAGADPRRAPAALAVAGYVEHAFGAWHVRGGLYAIVEALVRRLEAAGGELRLGTAAREIAVVSDRVSAVVTAGAEALPCDAVVSTVDAALEDRLVARGPGELRVGIEPERSLSGFALMLGLRGGRRGSATTPSSSRPTTTRSSTTSSSTAARCATRPSTWPRRRSPTRASAPPGDEGWFVLANAPTHGGRLDWDAHADAYEEHLLDRLARRGLDVRERIAVRARRTPADLERETGAPGGAIYGAAPHGRLGTVGRPANAARRPRGLYRAGGTVHPGGGLPLVMLGAKVVAEEIGPAR